MPRPPENEGAPPGGSDALSLKHCLGNEQHPIHTRPARRRSTRPLGPGELARAREFRKRGLVPFGKHRGRPREWLFFGDPGYVRWLLSEPSLNGPAQRLRNQVERLIEAIDEAPFEVRCCGRDCSNPVMYCAAYIGDLSRSKLIGGDVIKHSLETSPYGDRYMVANGRET